jgi:hypothetical protein
MAAIRSVFSPGQTLNVLDPNSWVGGVVPGPNDIAQIGENGNFYTLINMQSSPFNINVAELSHLKPWTGSIDVIRVDDNNIVWDGTYEFPDTDGSFLVYLFRNYSELRTPIKIDYVSKSLANDDFFYTCSIDYSYNNWVYKDRAIANLNAEGFNQETVGIIQDDSYVFPLETKFELTGSNTWHVGQIETLERCHLTIKGNSTLLLDGTTVNPNAIYNDQDSYRNVIRIIENATVELTGSVQRANNLFYFYNRDDYQRIQISGSDTCPHTTLSSNSVSGSSTIQLNDTTGFGLGSIISIDYPTQVEYVNSLASQSMNPYGRYFDYSLDSGSSAGPGYYGLSRITSSMENDEVVRVISQSSPNEFTVAKLFGKEGEIIQDFGTFDYNTFVETFNITPGVFSGNKRAVLVRSLHNDFQKGETLAISRSLVTECLYAGYYLSESKNIDFTAGDTLEDNLIYSPYVFSGSFVDSTFKAQAYYNEYYRWENNLLYGPRTGSSGEVTSSVYLRTDNDYIYTNNNPRTRAQVMVSGSYFKEGEVTAIFDMNQNLTGSYDTGAELHLNIGYHPGAYTAWKGSSRIRGIFQPCKKIVVRSNVISTMCNGQQGDGYDTVFGQQELLGEIYPNKIEAKIVHKRGQTDFYVNGTLITTQFGESSLAPIMLSLYRYVNLYSINIKDYHQLVLLDTDETVGVGGEVLEGARLEYDHFQDQRARTNANSIKDIRGYKNLLQDWLDKKGQTKLMPYLHGYVSSQSNKYDYNNLFEGDRLVAGELVNNNLGFYYHPGDYIKTGTGQFFVYDLGVETEFDSLSFRHYNDFGYDYNQMNELQIEVSNDIENWTTVYGPSSDSRYTTRVAQYRFFDFPSGSTTSRFIKISVSGTSRSTGNAITNLGIHHFNGRGDSLELYDSSMFAVGDEVVFVDIKNGGLITRADTSYDWLDWTLIPGVLAGTTTDNDVCGGLTRKFTITAIDGNVITVDRRIANSSLTKDTLVYKWNQGSVNLKGNYKNLIGFVISNFDGTTNNYEIVNANFDHIQYSINWLGGNRTFFSKLENCSFNDVGPGSSAVGGLSTKNNIYLGNGSLLAAYPAYGNKDSIVFNNLHIGNGAVSPYFYPDLQRNTIVKYNISLTSRATTWYSQGSNPTPSTTSRIIYKHNYLDCRHDPMMYMPFIYSFPSTRDGIIFKDNYTSRGYKGYYTTAAYPRIEDAFRTTFNYSSENIEPFKEHRVLSGEGEVSSVTLDNGLNTNAARDSVTFRYYPYDFTLKKPIIHLGPVNFPSIAYKEAPNRYGIISSYQMSPSIKNIPNLYFSRFTVYKAQEINIQLVFDYFLTKSQLYNFLYSTTDINRGYYSEDYNSFKVLLYNDSGNFILDKELLNNTTLSEFSYNKNFTLEAGDYSFGIHYYTNLRENYKVFEHGPISFNIFSTDPKNLKVTENTFDSYKMLESRAYGVKEVLTSDSLGPEVVKRVSNSLPTGTIKFRKIKL